MNDGKKAVIKVLHILRQIFLIGLIMIVFVLCGCTPQEEDQNEELYAEAKISVSIRDLTPPVILAKDVYTVQQGQDFRLQDYVQVSDNMDKNTGYECQGSFDTAKSGQYVVLLIATDTAGNQTQKNVTIIVTAPPTPEPEVENHPIPQESEPSGKSQQQAEGYSRDYLYAEGYTMSSASEACSKDLNSSGRSGRCDPILNAEGIYTGMHLQLY